jgi:hypothetical protein
MRRWFSRSQYQGVHSYFCLLSFVKTTVAEFLFRFISRSPSRGRKACPSPPTKPLSPCLVHRLPASLTPSTVGLRPIRRSSLPICDNTTRKQEDAITVPLRECCAKCETITDECLNEGESWQEKFTRGARRRRSASLDNGRDDRDNSLIGASLSRQRPTGLTSLMADPELARFRAPTFSLTVDEVDKRRKSLELAGEDSHQSHTDSPFGSSTLYVFPQDLGPFLSPKDSSTSLASTSELSPNDGPARRARSSPIQEEDEDQLFPLPSPRRSPNSSPPISPAPSINKGLSPNNSASSLAPHEAAPAAPKEQTSDSRGLQRRSPTHQPESSWSSTSTSDPSEPSTPICESKMEVSFASPPSPRPHPPPLSIPSRSKSLSGAHSASDLQEQKKQSSRRKRLSIELPLRSSPTTTNPSSGSIVPPSPRTPRKSPRIPAFSIPSLKDAFKGAGSDVLRGVSAMTGGSIAA